MSQQEIYDLLKEEEEPLTRSQIAERLNQDLTKVSHILSKLLEHAEIEAIEYSGEETTIKLNKKVCRRTRFYFISE
jgi:Mn-dependent DtxR family transcriptional regulator